VSSRPPQYHIGKVGHRATVLVGEHLSLSTGISPEEQLKTLKTVTDPLERLNKAQSDTIAKLEREFGATKEQVLGFFRIIGEARIEPEAIPGRLYEIAARYKALLAEAATKPGDDPETARLKGEVRAALEKPDLERADVLLAEVLAAQDREIERRALEAAATCAQRGELARTRLRYNEAAAHFRAAASRVLDDHKSERLDYLNRQAQALYLQGSEFGENRALLEAITDWRALLALCPRDRVPLDWATTQNNIGNALRMLGGRESGTARLEEAVVAYRSALEERTRERVPLDWATTQNNLGNALHSLGERESGTARLEEAVEAYDAGLMIFVSASPRSAEICRVNRERTVGLLRERRAKRKPRPST